MEFISLFENIGIPATMLAYFIWATNKKDKIIVELHLKTTETIEIFSNRINDLEKTIKKLIKNE